ncbi:hypothetical protein Caci_1280 [Catenulispora acidiphila DSM 44928]|uniref:Uncharacterized protein n=1 Tax=Catenulispora acidiphila (strain DSM 44928 / JCM 14897 / NBRC 102108 / NRRL B-24433 / ID139908) TaxID=479433 RepID=C7Q7B7_CATAD|nr:hypothetical protein [Catenulispora acidiphila]ACU70205.1 hypothetical protein Caci_1280 [Catenulispora acidiphila DSM 44928]
MSATGSNGNDNTAGSDPGEPQAHRAGGAPQSGGRERAGISGGFADLAALREAILRAERAGRTTPAGAAGVPAGPEALLEAVRRVAGSGSTGLGPMSPMSPLSPLSSVPAGAFALDAGPEPESDGDSDVPLRSRGGGVNTPRAVVPTPLLAAQAARLVDAAHTKRARMVSAIGLPAVFLAATGVAVMPTVANAASSSSPANAASTSCAAGSAAVANPAAKAAPKSAPSTKPTTAPSSAPSKSGSAPTPGAPKPSSSSTTSQPAPTSAPSGIATPAKPTPTSVPSSTTAPPTSAKTTAPPAPASTPSPSSSPTWWNPLGWLGTTVNQVFNPAPSSSSSTVNKLNAAPAADPTSTAPSTPTPTLSGTSAPSSKPSSAPSSAPSSKPSSAPSSKPSSLPSTPQPTSSGSSKPSAPTSSASTPSSAITTVTVGGKAIAVPPPSSEVCVAAAAPSALREIEWHLDASSLTLTNQKFLGFQDIKTGDGKTVTVMAIHADRVDLTDMVTYNEDGHTKIYSDGGKGKNVSLTNVTLHVLKQHGVIEPLLGIPLGEVTLGPPGEAGTDLLSQTIMALLQLNLPLPPTTFTGVSVDQYTLTSDTLNVPGFNVGLNAPS